MPGAWEFLKQQKVLCAILCTDTTTMAWALGLRNLQIPGHVMPFQGLPFDHARNESCKVTLQGGFDYLFCLDSDVVPPNDAILRLMAHNLPIVSGVYYRRSPPLGVPVMMKRDAQGNFGWITSFQVPALLEVDVVGAGCLLIRRDVLERMPPQRPGHQWFDWRVNLKGLGLYPDTACLSEDYTFCMHAAQHGFKTVVDTSILCRHIGCAESHVNPGGQAEFIPARCVG